MKNIAECCFSPEHVRLFYLDVGFEANEADAMGENWAHIKKKVDNKYGFPFRCVECQIEDTFSTSIHCHHGVMMAAENICFNCAFWTLYIRMPHPERAIVNGKHYVCYPIQIGERLGRHRDRGFGGDLFQVYYFDGRIVWSQDTWHQGKIPERFRYALSDNAEFVRKDDPRYSSNPQ